jgi:hypothetical protein
LVNLLEERRRGLCVNRLGVGGCHCIHDSRDEG